MKKVCFSVCASVSLCLNLCTRCQNWVWSVFYLPATKPKYTHKHKSHFLSSKWKGFYTSPSFFFFSNTSVFEKPITFFLQIYILILRVASSMSLPALSACQFLLLIMSVSGCLSGQSYLLSSLCLFISQQEREGEAWRSHRKQPATCSTVAS